MTSPVPALDIPALIARILQGERAGFAVLVRRYQGPLFAYLGRMGLSPGVAEELAQESFLRAWRHLADYDAARGAFSTWLFTIAHRLALSECAHPLRRAQQPWNDEVHQPACEAPQPHEALMQQQRRQQVQQALRALPLADRSVLALAYFEELDMAAIARIEGCGVGALKVRLHRARQRLRKELEQHHG